MTLAELLQQLPGARTVANARVWLEENVTVPDDTRVTSTAIMARMTPADAEAVFATLQAAAAANALVAESLHSLRGGGIDLSHDNAREMIDALFTEPLRAKVKALGEKVVPRWQQTDLARLKDGYIEEAL